MVRTLGLVIALVASTAFADAFSIEVGQTKRMGVSQRIVGVTVKNPAVVDIARSGSGVTLLGKEVGKTEIALRTVDGDEVEFMLYVTSEGAKVFSTTRGTNDVAPETKATLKKRKAAKVTPPAAPQAAEEAPPAQLVNSVPPAA